MSRVELRYDPSQFDVQNGSSLEWIITNGLGGYASSSILGANTRKYHGLLIAAMKPPLQRTLLLNKVEEELILNNNQVLKLSTNFYKDSIYPEGYRYLKNFVLAYFPCSLFSEQRVIIQKRVGIIQQKNATIIQYIITNSDDGILRFVVYPLINSRSFHALTHTNEINWEFQQDTAEHFANIVATYKDAPYLSLLSDWCAYQESTLPERQRWHLDLKYPLEEQRGEAYLEDNYSPGGFTVDIEPHSYEVVHIIAFASDTPQSADTIMKQLNIQRNTDWGTLLEFEKYKISESLDKFYELHGTADKADWLKWLIRAARSFIVKRGNGYSIIAGYHWFSDWGRDTFISLPGLLLVTGRYKEAQLILSTFAKYCRNGIIPNRFLDLGTAVTTGEEYNTVDGTLWYIYAVHQYLKYTNDIDFVRNQLWSILTAIMDAHIKGTDFNIKMDETDGLLSHGSQLTWMDAKVGDWTVTPREGKAVEIQALWYNALKIMKNLSRLFDDNEHIARYDALSKRVQNNFERTFWNEQSKCAYDCVNNNEKDASIRPNQLFIISLDYPLLSKEKQQLILYKVWDDLLTPYGLRSLSKRDPNYVQKYEGDRWRRDSAYHQGTVWGWLLGPFITSFVKLNNYEFSWRKFAFETFLKPYTVQLRYAGLGSISEIFDGESPHFARGCISQAWSVAEPLRAYIEDILYRRPPHEKSIVGDQKTFVEISS
ncbi:MAG: amylo-alpha-1,6-glucosidase [Promethearchaeota archaeon]